MRRGFPVGRVAAMGGVVLGLAAMAVPASAATRRPQAPPPPAVRVSAVSNVSGGCAGQNAEVEQAADPVRGYVYEAWIGCDGIGFARSADGGLHFGPPMSVPGSAQGWDPAVAVAHDGTVYVSYMVSANGYSYPVVAASFDHGRTFPQVSSLIPPVKGNWGDRDFIAVSPHGSVYVTWDYGPSASAMKFICTSGGSCGYSAGDVNVVVQKSTNGGKTWGPIIHVSPGFPASGGDSAPLVVEPGGRIDVAYQGYRITNDQTYAMAPAHTYFTSSSDGGATWSAPVRIGPSNLTMSLSEWWIDGAISIDKAGNLYATWDTQNGGQDIGWLSYSTDHGRTWSPLVRVTPGTNDAVHIVEVAGGRPGTAYVGWLTDSSPQGYALYLREFSIRRGWVSAPVQVSRQFGNDSIWPGDTFGISVLSGNRGEGRWLGGQRVAVSWGSAVGTSPDSEIYAADATFSH
jgi:hypothetical protein